MKKKIKLQTNARVISVGCGEPFDLTRVKVVIVILHAFFVFSWH